jgi:hypothetical protein
MHLEKVAKEKTGMTFYLLKMQNSVIINQFTDYHCF